MAAHRRIGTFPTGTLRVSLGPFTTEGDIDTLLAAVRDARNVLQKGGR